MRLEMHDRNFAIEKNTKAQINQSSPLKERITCRTTLRKTKTTMTEGGKK